MLPRPPSRSPVTFDLIGVLRNIPLFHGLDRAELEALAVPLSEKLYVRGPVILTQGEPGDALFLIGTGQVKVAVFAEDGREVILSVIGGGGFFGEMALLDDEPRSAHVIAMTDATL